MIEPRIPENEAQRIDSLQSTGLLDTEAEERFDRVTRLARRLFDVPIALVSLVDSNRQWFKSRQGLSARETARDISFCGHTILEDRPFVVSDAISDARFADNPLVMGEPNIRFYAGRPLHVPGGDRIGTLCVIDRRPRELDKDDLDLLRDLAEMVEDQLAAMEMATLDEMTGICNRRGFNMLAEKAVAASRRQGHDLTLLAFDMNDFKQINDREGHAAGDLALVDFAHCLTHCFRDSDVIARSGGDEFLVLLSHAPDQVVPELLHRLQDQVSAHNQREQRPFRLSYSVGVATCSAQLPDCLDFLVNEADEAMYIQKRYKLRSGDSRELFLQLGDGSEEPSFQHLQVPQGSAAPVENVRSKTNIDR